MKTADSLRRRAALLVAISLLASPLRADVESVKDDEQNLLTYKLEVTPADEPAPAFKHRFVYDLHERVPGNRPQWYARAYPEEFTAHRVWREAMSREDEAFDEYYQSGKPVSQIDWTKFEKPRSVAKSLFREHIVPGAMRRECDWGTRFETIRGPETISFLLPEFQGARRFSRMGSVATREAIFEKRYDDAIELLRTQYQLGSDVAQEPILVCTLIGIAITGIANGGTLDLIAAPDSPNLYWALSELPSPPIAVAEATRCDLSFAERMFPVLKDVATAERTPSEWNAAWERLVRDCTDGTINSDDQLSKGLLGKVAPALLGLSGYSHAKSWLVGHGLPSKEVEAMAVGQVLLRYTAEVVQIAVDEQRKATVAGLSYRQADKLGSRADRVLDRMSVLSDGDDRELVPISQLLLPAVGSARTAEVRCAREIAVLRVIEALRMHAARNDGGFPQSLDEVTCVPVPGNPVTGQPFTYHREGKRAVIELPDWEGIPDLSRRYEITIKP